MDYNTRRTYAVDWLDLLIDNINNPTKSRQFVQNQYHLLQILNEFLDGRVKPCGYSVTKMEKATKKAKT